MKRHTRFALLLLASFLLLGGCVNADMHITVNKDGSGTYRLKVLSHPLMEQQLNPIKRYVEEDGYRVRDLTEGNQKGWIAEKHVKNVAEDPPSQNLIDRISPSGKSASIGPFIGDMEKGPVKVESSLFTYILRFQTDIDLESMSSDDFIGQAFLNEVNLRLRLTLPMEPKSHNADSVSGDGKTLTWHLTPGEKNPVFVEIRMPNPVGWALVGLGVLLLFLVLVTLAILHHRKKKAESL